MQGTNRQLFEIFVLSALALFIELFVIRWLGAELQAFRVFKTFPLVACFVGMGAGFAATSADKFRLSALAFLAFVLISCAPMAAHISWVSLPSISVFVGWHNVTEVAPDLGKYLLFFCAYLTLILLAIYAPMYCLGSKIGALMRENVALQGYNYNLLGSIAGSAVFSVLTFCMSPPWIVAAVGGLALLAVLWSDSKLRIVNLVCVALVPAILYIDPGKPANVIKTYWSPYQRIDIVPARLTVEKDKQKKDYDVGVEIESNHMLYQPALIAPAADQPKEIFETLRHHQRAHVLPFLLKPAPQDVLIVGAGNGYDVAEALEHGAKSIDAVDIDPSILDAGKRFHPRKPYQDPRVNQICEDARAYFNSSPKKYDLIFYAFLDSHVALSSGMSSRLDNYVYTKESFQAACKHLKPDGLLVVAFFTAKPWFIDRLFNSLSSALDYTPAVVLDTRSSWGFDPSTLLLAGAAVKTGSLTFPPDQNDVFNFVPNYKPGTNARSLTDDWPYLHVIPTAFDFPYFLIVLVCLGLSFYAGRRFLLKPSGPVCWQLFFMGAAFLLLELQAIARLNQLFGTSWLSSAVAINCILILAWAGNLLVFRKSDWFAQRVPLVYLGLFSTLLLSYFLPLGTILELLNSLPWLAKFLLSFLSVLPLGFAGIIFSSSLARAQNTATALAFNLYGALIGGMLEYVSIYIGINAMALIALGFYGLSLMFFLRQKDPPTGA